MTTGQEEEGTTRRPSDRAGPRKDAVRRTVCLILTSAGCFTDPGNVSSSSESATGSETVEGTASTDEGAATATSTSDPGTSTSSDDGSSSLSDTSTQEAGALFFDGDDEARTTAVPQATLPAEFTVELWVQTGEEPYFGVLVDTRTLPGPTTDGWILLVQPTGMSDAGKLILNWSGVDGSPAHGFTGPDVSRLSPGWHHWAFTRNADGLTQCWLDGELSGESPFEDPASRPDL